MPGLTDADRRVDDERQNIDRDVTTILFPGSAKPGLTPETIAAVTRRESARFWAALRARPARR